MKKSRQEEKHVRLDAPPASGTVVFDTNDAQWSTATFGTFKGVDFDAILDPTNEFEAVLIEMVKMHRLKSQQYGARGDKLQNFYNMALAEGITPLTACQHVSAKHRSVIKEYVLASTPEDHPDHTPATDDAFLDDAVYGVLRKILYDRELQ